jgi:hypothetical protein
MIEAPKITDEQQNQFRYDFIKMIEEFNDQDELEPFRSEWDGAVHFQIIDDHTVMVNIAGEEKTATTIKRKNKRYASALMKVDIKKFKDTTQQR